MIVSSNIAEGYGEVPQDKRYLRRLESTNAGWYDYYYFKLSKLMEKQVIGQI